mgnify:CR=1 FL=1
MSTKKKPSTPAILPSRPPSACAKCKYLGQRSCYFINGRGVQKSIICTLDDHPLNGDLDKLDENCPLDNNDEE